MLTNVCNLFVCETQIVANLDAFNQNAQTLKMLRFYDFLKKRGELGMSDKALCGMLGYNYTAFPQIKSGYRNAPQHLIEKFYARFAKYVDEFTSSLQAIEKAASERVEQQRSVGFGNIIYVPLVAYGGFLQGYANKVYVDSLSRFNLPGITGEHYAFEVDGMSMYDLAAPGDFAIAKPEEKLEYMVKGKIYVLQTIDGILIKIFDKITGEQAAFHSFNKDYDGLTLPLKSLKRVYFVSRILKKI